MTAPFHSEAGRAARRASSVLPLTARTGEVRLDELRTAPAFVPGNGEEALVHPQVAEALVAAIDCAGDRWVKLRPRRHAVRDEGPARPDTVVDAGAVPGPASVEHPATARDHDLDDLQIVDAGLSGRL